MFRWLREDPLEEVMLMSRVMRYDRLEIEFNSMINLVCCFFLVVIYLWNKYEAFEIESIEDNEEQLDDR